MFEFTPRQRRLIAIAMNNGGVTIQDSLKLYSDPRNAMNAIRRLVMAGIVTPEFGVFRYNKESDINVIEVLQK